MRLVHLGEVLGLSAIALAAPRKGSPDPEKAQAIKDAYKLSWNGYYKYAFPNDSLAPLNKTFVNDR